MLTKEQAAAEQAAIDKEFPRLAKERAARAMLAALATLADWCEFHDHTARQCAPVIHARLAIAQAKAAGITPPTPPEAWKCTQCGALTVNADLTESDSTWQQWHCECGSWEDKIDANRAEA